MSNRGTVAAALPNHAEQVVGNGTSASCTSKKVVQAFASARWPGNGDPGRAGLAPDPLQRRECDDRSGEVEIVDSVLRDNMGDGFSTHPGIFFLGRSITFTDSNVE